MEITSKQIADALRRDGFADSVVDSWLREQGSSAPELGDVLREPPEGVEPPEAEPEPLTRERIEAMSHDEINDRFDEIKQFLGAQTNGAGKVDSWPRG